MFDFPATPTDGQKFTPAGGATYIWSAATTAWKIQGSIGASGNAFVSDTPPAGAQQGQFWLESDTGNLFMWWDDGNSQQWVQINVPNSVNSLTRIVETQVLTSGIYTKPAGLKFLEVDGVGGGGGSSACISAVANNNAVSSSGGGAGSGHRIFAASELAATTPYTVGAGGAGGTGSTGGAGGQSEFGSGLNCTCPGGGGGPTRTGSVTGVTSISGGGGGGVGAGWTSGLRGENGHNSVAALSGALSLRGAGGASRWGYCSGSDAYVGNGAAAGGAGFGAGATGAATYNAGAAQNGGDGSQGMFIFREYF